MLSAWLGAANTFQSIETAQVLRAAGRLWEQDELSAHTQGDRGRNDRQRARMVRFCDLRLFRSPDWSPLLPASRSGRPAAFGIRCICDRLSDAAYRRRVGRPYRRQVAAGWLSDRVGRKPLMLFA